MSVPYYDCADGRLLNMLSEDNAERYLSTGAARAIRSKKGRVVRLYSVPTERVPGSISAAISAMHASASQTTHRMRDKNGVLISAPTAREHHRPQPMTGSPRANVPLAKLNIVLHGVPELSSGSWQNSDNPPAELPRTILNQRIRKCHIKRHSKKRPSTMEMQCA
jgi:hypothetical protein